jgi:hypothetical protein
MLLAMFGRLQIAAIFLLSIPIYAQNGPAKLLAEIDLRQFGVSVPPKGTVSAKAMELLFLSDNDLVLLEESDRPDKSANRLTLYEVGEGVLRPKKTIDPGEATLPISPSYLKPEKVLEWVDSEHFVYWTYRSKPRRYLCDADLNCAEDNEEPAPETVPPARICRPADFLGFIDAHRAVCLTVYGGTKWSARVLDATGHPLYEVEQGALPWNARMVRSVEGERFGLEWESNTPLQLVNPLACIDECPPAGKQQFVVFNSSDGRMLQSFEWDPRPYNLHVLPGLSPSGKTAALVRKDELVIYSLETAR